MRGKQIMNTKQVNTRRITPADAGKTSRHLVGINQSQDHPRGCGENDVRLRKFDPVPGSPPRMRGKLIDSILSFSMPRITPADAGKTRNFRFRSNQNQTQDHPRGCGENKYCCLGTFFPAGSPPRMRGKLNGVLPAGSFSRITPADAGKTRQQVRKPNNLQDHPRGCGENDVRECRTKLNMGSPPRMRGKLSKSTIASANRRITPADAGKTG